MDECLFCKIIRGEIPAKKEFENDNLIVIRDINPKAPKHLLFIPKRHISSLIEASDKDRDLLGGIMLQIKLTAAKLDLDKSGYKVVINNGRGSGQIVFHLHLHLLGGWGIKAEGWTV